MRDHRSSRACACMLIALAAAVTALAPGAGSAEAAKFGQRALKPGMKGKDVRTLQRSLTRLKLPTVTDSQYGKATRKNVLVIERKRGWIPVNGWVSRIEAKRIKGLVNSQRAKKKARPPSGAGYAFPIPQAHDFGGPQSRFGAARSGHSHQGQDVFAACGSRLLAAHGGIVKTRAYQASGAGYYLVVDGIDGNDYVYMHLKKASWAVVGTSLYPGQQIGRVGDSGNASGCHLHFEMWTAPGWYAGGTPFDPLPALLEWDSYS